MRGKWTSRLEWMALMHFPEHKPGLMSLILSWASSKAGGGGEKEDCPFLEMLVWFPTAAASALVTNGTW